MLRLVDFSDATTIEETPADKQQNLQTLPGYSASKLLWVGKGKATVVRVYLYSTYTALDVVSTKKI